MYKPLPKCLTIKESEIEGLGLFAKEKLPAGLDLGITHVENTEFENGYIRTPLGGFYNHSEEPNCIIIKTGMVLRLKTQKEIDVGEELTAHYTLYNVREEIN